MGIARKRRIGARDWRADGNRPAESLAGMQAPPQPQPPATRPCPLNGGRERQGRRRGRDVLKASKIKPCFEPRPARPSGASWILKTNGKTLSAALTAID
jgi:hypothetical protein